MTDAPASAARFGGSIPRLRAALLYAVTGIVSNFLYFSLMTGNVGLCLIVLTAGAAAETTGDRLLWYLDDAPVTLFNTDRDVHPLTHWWLILIPMPGIIAGVLSPDFILWDAIGYVRGMLL